jgi:hypothetical protein
MAAASLLARQDGRGFTTSTRVPSLVRPACSLVRLKRVEEMKPKFGTAENASHTASAHSSGRAPRRLTLKAPSHWHVTHHGTHAAVTVKPRSRPSPSYHDSHRRKAAATSLAVLYGCNRVAFHLKSPFEPRGPRPSGSSCCVPAVTSIHLHRVERIQRNMSANFLSAVPTGQLFSPVKPTRVR